MQIAELDEVAFVSSIKCGGDTTARIRCGGEQPWSASLDGGIVTVRHKRGGLCYVPLTNVSFMMAKPPPEPKRK